MIKNSIPIRDVRPLPFKEFLADVTSEQPPLIIFRNKEAIRTLFYLLKFYLQMIFMSITSFPFSCLLLLNPHLKLSAKKNLFDF